MSLLIVVRKTDIVNVKEAGLYLETIREKGDDVVLVPFPGKLLQVVKILLKMKVSYTLVAEKTSPG